MKIAIDGPGGAGKSTLAKNLARRLGLIYLDTGALYRSVGYAMLSRGIAPDDREAVAAAVADLRPELKYIDGEQHVFVDDEDVTALIRVPEISAAASKVSAMPEVRARLDSIQKSMAKAGNVVIDGRDIGTVIMPDADFKLFLIASGEARARRRYEELTEKGESANYAEILSAINERDARDSGREVAPLKPADDAILLDNSGFSSDETLDYVIGLIEKSGKLAK